MCRSIKKLRNPQNPASEAEIREAAVQYIRKVSGYREPSKANREAFEKAINEVASTTHLLLLELQAPNQKKSSTSI